MPSDTVGFQVAVDITPEDVIERLSSEMLVDFITDLADGLPDEAIELLRRRLGEVTVLKPGLSQYTEEDLRKALAASEEDDAQAGG